MFRINLKKCARVLTLALAALVALSLVGPGVYAGNWKGQVTKKNGAAHVMNPSEPMESPITIQLVEQWRLGGDTDDEDEFFGVINRVVTDKDGNIYLLDSQLNEVKVYSTDGEYLNTLGREGEGPGEFRRPVDMFFLPDGNLGVLQLAPGRIVMLTTDGEPAGEYPLVQNEAGETLIFVGGQLMGSNLLLIQQENKLGEGKIDITRCMTMINSEGKEVKRLHQEVRTMEFANAVIDEKVWSTFDRRWQVSPDGRVFAVTQFPDYEIQVWNSDGALEQVISREFDKYKRTEKEIEDVYNIFEAFTRQVPNAQIKISDFDQDISNIYPRDDGTLWVMNARGLRDEGDGSLGSFDVFNRQGQFVREVTLKGEGDPQQDGYFFVGDRLFVVTGFLDAAMAAQGGAADTGEDEEEAEPMAVICYQVGPLKAGMN